MKSTILKPFTINEGNNPNPNYALKGLVLYKQTPNSVSENHQRYDHG